MRCKACDERLTARESTRKGLFTGEYIDLCDKCVETIKEDIGMVDNPLNATHQQEDEDNAGEFERLENHDL